MQADGIECALALYRTPHLVADVRRQPLPEGMLWVVRTAAGDSQALEALQKLYTESADELIEACGFFVQQAMFAPEADAYRVLGVRADDEAAVIREHHRWLIRWLHPDRIGEDWLAMFADRVNHAWHQLRNPDRRRQYDADRALGLPVQPGFVPLPRSPRVSGRHALLRSSPMRHTRARWATAAALVVGFIAIGIAWRHAPQAPAYSDMPLGAEASADFAPAYVKEIRARQRQNEEPAPLPASPRKRGEEQVAGTSPRTPGDAHSVLPPPPAADPYSVLPPPPAADPHSVLPPPPAADPHSGLPPPPAGEGRGGGEPTARRSDTPSPEAEATPLPASPRKRGEEPTVEDSPRKQGEEQLAGTSPRKRGEEQVAGTSLRTQGEEQVAGTSLRTQGEERMAATSPRAPGEAEASLPPPLARDDQASLPPPPAGEGRGGGPRQPEAPHPKLDATHVLAFIAHFQVAYERGELGEFMDLFSADARNNRGGRDAIREDYGRLFASTRSRQIHFDDLAWAGDGHSGELRGRFLARVEPLQGRRPSETRGEIRFSLILEGNEPRIASVLHSVQ